MGNIWYLVAIMLGVHEDGKVDVYIFREPKNSPGFYSTSSCRNFVSENPTYLIETLRKQYGDRPMKQLICAPVNSVKQLLETTKQ